MPIFTASIDKMHVQIETTNVFYVNNVFRAIRNFVTTMETDVFFCESVNCKQVLRQTPTVETHKHYINYTNKTYIWALLRGWI